MMVDITNNNNNNNNNIFYCLVGIQYSLHNIVNPSQNDLFDNANY